MAANQRADVKNPDNIAYMQDLWNRVRQAQRTLEEYRKNNSKKVRQINERSKTMAKNGGSNPNYPSTTGKPSGKGRGNVKK